MNVKLTARCTVVVAAAGYGKTMAVRRWLGEEPARWCSGSLPPEVGGEWVVVDDVFTASETELLRLLDGPSEARLVLISRWPVSNLGRLARHGLVEEHGPADLALTPDETAAVLREHGVTDPIVAANVFELTAGWPALVRLAATRPDGAGRDMAAFLDKHVLTPMPPSAARLLRDMAHLGPADVELFCALGHRRPGATLAQLTRIGVVGRNRGPVPAVAQAARERWPLSPADRARLFGTAGDWYVTRHRPGDAIAAYLQCGRLTEAVALLRTHGSTWVIAGGAATIAATIDALPPADRDPALRRLYGEALLVLGEDDRAFAELNALAGAESTTLPSGLAWRLGAVHYLRADPHAAIAIFARGCGPMGTDTQDDALLVAWDAAARWMAGDVAACGERAEQARRAADRADDDRARAAAHVALSMHAMLVGDRPGNAAHLDQALHFAEAAGDIVQAARIHGNVAARLLEEAQYPQALVEARQSKALAEATGYAAILAVARCNEADALFRLGCLDEAAASYQKALETFQQKRSQKVAYPLIGLGTIHRARGRHNLARAAYEEAARAASATGDVQGMVPALAGLARVLAATDPAGALVAADRARAAASGPYCTEAWLATGWARIGAADLAGARGAGTEATTQARRHRDACGLAEALELRAAVSLANDEAADARCALREAGETWRLTNSALDVDRVACALGALPDASVADRITARLARDRLEAAGVAPPDARRPTEAVPAAPVAIRTLGRFEVCVGDTPVTMSMWQSRKARDLLRVLVARRGRAIARDELTELLWPDGDPDRLAHRLSVALSTVRSVLDPDRLSDQDHYVLADRSGVALDTDSLAIDLEHFLAEVSHGLALRDQGRRDDAHSVLAAAERRYRGDFLENEPYEDWSVAAREEARAAYLRTVRTLAELSRCAGRVDDAVHYLLKVIDKDPYDEAGHLELVAILATAGRHGESRRAQARYVAAMHDIGVELRAG